MTEKKHRDKVPLYLSKENLSQSELFKSAANTIKSYKMLEKDDSVLISISGGPDSVFMTVLLQLLKPEFNLNLSAFHLDHMTRNGKSSEDADFVKAFCQNLGIKLFAEKYNVPSYCMMKKLNFQEGARSIRQSLLLKYSEENKINKIAVAHNADDNVETFFMNIMRGAGLRGLSAIKPKIGKIIRPLMFCCKKDIVDFLAQNNIGFCIDSTNLENKYLRNKIRNKLIPYIEKNFENEFKQKISRSIIALGALNNYIENLSHEIIEDLLDNQESSFEEARKQGFLVLSASAVSLLEEFVKSEVIIRCIEIVKGDLREINHKNVSDILELSFPGGESRTIDLSDNISFLREGNYLYFYDKNKIKAENIIKKGNYLQPADLIEDLDFQYHSDFQFIIIPDLSYQQAIEYLKGNEKIINYKMNFALEMKLLRSKNINMEEILNSDNEEAYIDFEKIKFPLKARYKKIGDRFFPLGMNAEKKLQDVFTDMKISLHKRSFVPVFFDLEKIIWLGGLRIDNRVKVTDSTEKILYLKISGI